MASTEGVGSADDLVRAPDDVLYGRRRIGLSFGSRVGIRNIEVIDIAGPLGIFVQDHIIIRKNGHACIKGLKLI